MPACKGGLLPPTAAFNVYFIDQISHWSTLASTARTDCPARQKCLSLCGNEEEKIGFVAQPFGSVKVSWRLRLRGR
jgi:hypothetical protein